MAETAAPWGPRNPDEAAPAAPAPATSVAARPRLEGWIWGGLSTLALAGWLALVVGPLGALALVIGVFVHEFGHVLVINWAGAGPSSIRIIPFFGGAATMRRAPDSDFKGVLIALAGPAFGLIAAAPFALATLVTHQRSWMVGAFYVGALNLINLAPAAPLDGAKALGPALARIHPWLERIVLVAIAALALAWSLLRGSIIFAAVIALGALRAFATAPPRVSARPLTVAEWAASIALYAATIGACGAVTIGAAQAGGVATTLFSFGGAR